MKYITQHILFALAMVLVTASIATAQSVTIRLQDGTTWRGQVNDTVTVRYVQNNRETSFTGRLVNVADLYIVVEGRIANETTQRTIFRGNIRGIEKVDSGDEQVEERRDRPDRRPDSADRRGDRDREPAALDDGLPGVFVLPMSGMVGLEFRHDQLRQLGEYIDENYGEGQIIVLEMDSGGGTVEMREVHNTIMDLKQRHRVVAWIERALSAAAASAIACDEIYFKRNGTLGAMTGYMGDQALQGEQLEEWLRFAREWMENGGRYAPIADAMIHAPRQLSYDKDEETGEVTWYDDLSGEYILSRRGENLTFNASNAYHSGFANGVADTKEDLAKLLDLPRWYETSDHGREVARNWHATVERAQQQMQRIVRELNNPPTSDQMALLGIQIDAFRRLANLRRQLGDMPADLLGIPPRRIIEENLAELQKQQADLRRAQRGQR